MSRPDLFTRDRNWHPPQYDPGYKSTVLRSPRRNLISLEKGGEGELTGTASVFVRATSTPIACAEISLSRTAAKARPKGARNRLR